MWSKLIHRHNLFSIKINFIKTINSYNQLGGVLGKVEGGLLGKVVIAEEPLAWVKRSLPPAAERTVNEHAPQTTSWVYPAGRA